MDKLTKREQKESMAVTFGRLKTAIKLNKDLDRAILLFDKFEKDFDSALIEENYFK